MKTGVGMPFAGSRPKMVSDIAAKSFIRQSSPDFCLPDMEPCNRGQYPGQQKEAAGVIGTDCAAWNYSASFEGEQ